MTTISAAQITTQAVEDIATAVADLAPFTEDQGYYDWTNWQGAENALLSALVRVRIAKQGILRRDPSFTLPGFSRAEADISRAVSAALDSAMSDTTDAGGDLSNGFPRCATCHEPITHGYGTHYRTCGLTY